jgi:hypothetical protein
LIFDNERQSRLAPDAVRRTTPFVDDKQWSDEMAAQRVHFRLVTPFDPWKNDFYERLHRAINEGLGDAFAEHALVLSELQTALYRFADVVNQRPLTYLYRNDQEVLITTPKGLAHSRETFLVFDKKVVAQAPRQISLVEMRDSLEMETLSTNERRIYYQGQQFHLEVAWRTFYRSYSNALKCLTPTFYAEGGGVLQQTPRVGEIVLIQDPYSPQPDWPFGRVESVTYNKGNQDALHRPTAVDVLTKTGRHYQLPPTAVFPLEISGHAVPPELTPPSSKLSGKIVSATDVEKHGEKWAYGCSPPLCAGRPNDLGRRSKTELTRIPDPKTNCGVGSPCCSPTHVPLPIRLPSQQTGREANLKKKRIPGGLSPFATKILETVKNALEVDLPHVLRGGSTKNPHAYAIDSAESDEDPEAYVESLPRKRDYYTTALEVRTDPYCPALVQNHAGNKSRLEKAIFGHLRIPEPTHELKVPRTAAREKVRLRLREWMSPQTDACSGQSKILDENNKFVKVNTYVRANEDPPECVPSYPPRKRVCH